METTTTKQELLKLIHVHVDIAPESTLEKVLELLEDEEDLRDYDESKTRAKRCRAASLTPLAGVGSH